MTEDPVSIKAVPGVTLVTKSEEIIAKAPEEPVTFADIKDSGVRELSSPMPKLVNR